MTIPYWMSRTQLLLGDEKLTTLVNKNVLVVGLGVTQVEPHRIVLGFVRDAERLQRHGEAECGGSGDGFL